MLKSVSCYFEILHLIRDDKVNVSGRGVALALSYGLKVAHCLPE